MMKRLVTVAAVLSLMCGEAVASPNCPGPGYSATCAFEGRMATLTGSASFSAASCGIIYNDTASSAITVIIPTNVLPNECLTGVIQTGAGNATITNGTGESINGGTTTAGSTSVLLSPNTHAVIRSLGLTSAYVTVVPNGSHGAPIAITVGSSPFAYTATAPGTVWISGGTVSGVTVTQGGTVVASGQVAGDFPVTTGDVVTVTYTAAPTMTFMP